jgi:predicted ATPase
LPARCPDRSTRAERDNLELRAATSLARLWRDQDRRIEARDLLARIYARFTEGFGCADLKKGEALLDALA